MNFGTTRLIALVLLFVAVGAQDRVGKLVGSVILRSREDHRTIGAINFWQPKASIKQVYLYANIWDIPDGTYIAVVHTCNYGNDNICNFGPARAQINQVEDVTKGREPMTLFRRVFDESMSQTFSAVATGVSLQSYAKDDITGSHIAIYRDTPAGMKLCSQSQNNTAEFFAVGYTLSSLIGSKTPSIPNQSDV